MQLIQLLALFLELSQVLIFGGRINRNVKFREKLTVKQKFA